MAIIDGPDIGPPDHEGNMNTPEWWNNRYETILHGSIGSGNRLYHLAAEELEDGSTILDIGGGEGNEAQIIMDALPNCRIWVLDISSVAGEYGKAAHPDMEFITADFEDVELDIPPFDYIITSQCLEHFDDPNYIVGKMMGLLKEGGVLYIGLPHEDALYGPHQHRFTHDSYHMFMKYSRWVSFSGNGMIHMFVRLIKEAP